MRKTFSALLIFLLLLSGCSGSDKKEPEKAPEPSEEVKEEQPAEEPAKEETAKEEAPAEGEAVATSEEEEEETIKTITIALQGDETSTLYQAFPAFETTLEGEYPNDIAVEITTGAADDLISSVQDGDVTLAVVDREYFEAKNPFLDMFDSWFLLLDYEHYRDVMLDKVGEVMFDEMSQNSSVKVLNTLYMGSSVFAVRDLYDIKTLDDWYDVDLGVHTNERAIAEAKALGANPVLFVPKNTYRYLVEKMINAFETTPSEIKEARYDEIVNTVVDTNHTFDFGFIIMNSDMWHKLDAAQKDVVRSAIAKVVEYYDNFAISDRKELMGELEAMGLEIDTVDPAEYFYAFSSFYRNNSEYTENWNTEYYERILRLGINLMNEREEAARKAEEEAKEQGEWVISGE